MIYALFAVVAVFLFYHSASVRGLNAEVYDLQGRVFDLEEELDDLRHALNITSFEVESSGRSRGGQS